MEDKLLVIKESDLDYILSNARMSGSAKIMLKDRTFPASEVFEAALEKVDEDKPEHWEERYGSVYYLTSGMEKYNLYETYTDYEKTKI